MCATQWQLEECITALIDRAGATVKAALRGVRQNKPRRLILAVPVAPPGTLEELAHECDEIICLSAPEWFRAVGSHYVDFDQTSDGEVVSLLAAARATRPAT